jgi:tetratricopeptide (TPR) repeat protein
LGLDSEAVEVAPEMAVRIDRLITRLDEPVPQLSGADTNSGAALATAETRREEIEANYDRDPDDWSRLERTFRHLARSLASAGDPLLSEAWLGVARCTRYQRGRRDDTLTAYIEALYWDRGNPDAWHELLDFAAAAPYARTLVGLYARIPFKARPQVLQQLVSVSHGHDRLGNMAPEDGAVLRAELLALAEKQQDRATIAVLTGQAGIAAERAGDLAAAVEWWRRSVAAGGTDEKVADRFSVWLAKQHHYAEAAQVLRQALAVQPRSAEMAERMRRRLARCERASPGEADNPDRQRPGQAGV